MPQYPGEAVNAGLGGATETYEGEAISGASWSSPVQRGGSARPRRAPGVLCPEPTILEAEVALQAAPETGVRGVGTPWRNPHRTGLSATASAARAPGDSSFGSARQPSPSEMLSISNVNGSSGQNSWRQRSSERDCDTGSPQDAGGARHAVRKHQDGSSEASRLLPAVVGALENTTRVDGVDGVGLIGVAQKRYAGVAGTAPRAGDTQEAIDGDSCSGKGVLSADLRQATSGNVNVVSHSRSSALPASSSAEVAVDGAAVGHSELSNTPACPV